MPAVTVVANTAASLSGKTLATLEDVVNFLGVYTAAPASPPDNSAWIVFVPGTGSLQLWTKIGGVQEYVDLATRT